MNEELRDHLRQLDAAVEEAQSLIASLDEESLNWKLNPETWSVAQCLDHLSVTANQYSDALEPVIAQAPRGGNADKPPKRGLVARWFIGVLEPPVGFRAKAPQPFVPRDRIAPEQLARDYAESHRVLRERMESSDGIDLGAVKLRSPAASWMKLRLGECYAVLCAHERRHLWQARRVLAAEGFPAKS